MDPLELLLATLEDLTAKDLKKFQLYLTEGVLEGFHRIPKGKLEKFDPTDTAGMILETYGSDGALKIALLILRKMKHNDLADKLDKALENSGSTVLSYSGEDSGSAIRQLVSQQLKDELKNKYTNIFEGPEEHKIQLDKVYTELHVTKGVSEEVNTQHEVQQIQMQTKCELENDITINSKDIMKSSPGNKVRIVMTIGIAGIGKSVCVQKFCLDWAEGRTNQDIDFIFVLPFRELNLVENEFSLSTLLQFFYPELENLHDVHIYENSKILFVFDGLDESRVKLDFKFIEKLRDVKRKSSVSMLLTNLIEAHLLRSSLIWITSRPAAADQIPSRYIDKWTEIRGFDDTQKDEYFSKRLANSHTNKIISQIKTRRSLYIMCHIPVFCWILVCVLQEMVFQDCKIEIPATMTELFIHFLIIQTNRKNQRCYGQSETDRPELLERHKEHILKLSELAFKQLEKGRILFSKRDLRESGIEDSEIKQYSEICTEIFKKDHTFYKKTFFCFVHLSVQEFLAALHVFHSFATKNYKALESFSEQMRSPVPDNAQASSSQSEDKMKNPSKIKLFFMRSENLKSFVKRSTPPKGNIHTEEIPLHSLLNKAVSKSLHSKNGHYDLFLRFLLGISLESNQDLLQGLLPQVVKSLETIKTTTMFIKDILSQDSQSIERCQNLLLCLLEMKDNSLHKEIEEYVKSGNLLTPAQCSSQAYMLLMSEEVLDEFNLTMYRTSQEGRKRLLIVLRGCRKARLNGCGLSGDFCGVISSILQLQIPMRELDLSSNPLKDSGVELLSAGLNHTNCRLETLRLSGCGLTEDSCRTISYIIQSGTSHLKDLDLSFNHLKDFGVEMLSTGLTHKNCRLETLRLASCNLTKGSCHFMALCVQSTNSHLTELDLTNNDLMDAGVKELSEAFQCQNCKLETLKLSGCCISTIGCALLAAALRSNSSLKALDLGYNHVRHSAEVSLPFEWRKFSLCVHPSSQCFLNAGPRKYACKLTLDPDTAHTLLCLSEEDKKVTRVEEHQPYPDLPERFHQCCQVLCREILTRRCYWEVEWSGSTGVSIGVVLESISREGNVHACLLGYNHKSWSLCCRDDSYCVIHCDNTYEIDAFRTQGDSRRVGVFLDREAGTLSFYSVSSDTLTLLHTFTTTFTDKPLYAGFTIFEHSALSLII